MKEGKLYSVGWDEGSDFELAWPEPSDEMRPPRDEPSARPTPAVAVASPAPPPASAPRPSPRAPVAQLPPFPRCDRPGYFPAFFARSGLFPAERVIANERQDARRDFAGQDKLTGSVDGPRLSMGDKLVFETLVDMAKSEGLELHEPLRRSAREIARAMGWKDSGGGTSRYIWDCVERLARTRVEFATGQDFRRGGKLLLSAAKRGEKGIEVMFDPSFVLPAFGAANKQYRIDRERRERLSSPLAKWLHDFASTHSKPHPIDLDYLRQRCGFGGRPKSFAERLRAAADELLEQAPELLAAYELDHRARSSKNWLITLHRGSEKAGLEF